VSVIEDRYFESGQANAIGVEVLSMATARSVPRCLLATFATFFLIALFSKSTLFQGKFLLR